MVLTHPWRPSVQWDIGVVVALGTVAEEEAVEVDTRTGSNRSLAGVHILPRQTRNKKKEKRVHDDDDRDGVCVAWLWIVIVIMK